MFLSKFFFFSTIWRFAAQIFLIKSFLCDCGFICLKSHSENLNLSRYILSTTQFIKHKFGDLPKVNSFSAPLSNLTKCVKVLSNRRVFLNIWIFLFSHNLMRYSRIQKFYFFLSLIAHQVIQPANRTNNRICEFQKLRLSVK